jgi:hypothetical protein
MPCPRPPFCTFMLTLRTLVILQFLHAPPVFAEWVSVGGNETARIYVDPTTRQQNGTSVTIWVLDDFQTVHTRGSVKYRSSRIHEEHDCKEQRFRLLALENFSGSMGSGKKVDRRVGETRWAPIPPGTLAQSVWKYVCLGKQ